MKKIAFILFLILTSLTVHVCAQNQKSQAKPNNKTVSKPSVEKNKDALKPSVPIEKVALSSDSLSKLKAVLVVGPVEDLTQEFIDADKEIAAYLRGLGVKVKEFYDPDANWADIILEANDAHIFIYSGHGSFLGGDGKVGGFCLSKGNSVNSASILKDLKLHKNALVIFHKVCLGAGSSAGDTADIGVKTAIQRISDYANPFIKNSAGCYYANNYLGSIVPFLKDFFNKKTIQQIYATATSSKHIEPKQKFIYNPRFEVSVSSTNSTGFSTRTTSTNGAKKAEKVPIFKEYDIALVSTQGYNVKDLFK